MKRFLIVLTVAAGAAACSGDEPGRLPLSGEPVDVTVTRAERAPGMEDHPAAVVSTREAEIATRVSGTVAAVEVRVGDRVAAGAPLLRLDSGDVDARIEAARANLALAERSFARISSLAADGAASQAELDRATAALEGARAGVREAEAQRAYVVVRAPFAGVVTKRNVDPGDLAAPGRPLLTLLAPGTLKVTADLAADRAGSVTEGTEMSVRVAGVAQPLVTRVSRVVGALEPGSRTFRVEAPLRDAPASVLPGSYARVELAVPGEGPRWIPEDAVVRRGQLTGVYTVEEGVLRLRWVRLGKTVDGAVELLAGPAGEMDVVRRPSNALHDGQPVGTVHTVSLTEVVR
ncbi:MAG: efflux RND transporter periplasmic adaptor subunit [Gemmatimonadota bacterium]